MATNSFTVYNASAGSGKTFTLVKEYLKTLFVSQKVDKYKGVLAITFTNKAVAEMKNRVLVNLKSFADSRILFSPIPNDLTEHFFMFDSLAKELSLSPKTLHEKAIRIHDAVLNNYAAFDIVTIDTFTHRIIRTFAYDLKLAQNFEVVLDTDEILNEAISNVLVKVGEDKALTKLLIDFALLKADDDRSWDISSDLYKTSRLLLNENEIKHLDLLKDKSLKDFDLLKSVIEKKITEYTNALNSISIDLINEFEIKQIPVSDIKHVHAYFLKLSKNDFSVSFDRAWQAKLVNGEPIYLKKTSSSNAALIDQLQSRIVNDYEQTKKLFFQLSFLNNFSKNLVPLSVLNIVNKEIQNIKNEQNVLLISEFNKLISNEIKDQPAPFIYERIGERYRNFFIDEFQDTSKLQWQNLIPLIDNALSISPNKNDKHSLLLVGDAKQSIYRWRGGSPEQFINLYENENPFYLQKKVENLSTNYRSYSEIIDFNNNFFSSVSSKFKNDTHKELYEIGNQQNQNNKKGGFVKLSFIENVKDEFAVKLYQDKVLETIKSVLSKGFSKSDICIVTRKTKDGIAIADFLTENEIPIISSETLLINKSKEVKFIISFLNYLLYPEGNVFKLSLLQYLYIKLKVQLSEHEFYNSFLKENPQEFFNELFNSYQVEFNYKIFQTLPLYELVEQIIRSFDLVDSSDAYIQYFLDEVLNFTQHKQTGIQGFLEFWETKKDKLSIVAPQGTDAITLMTIHKSKGLEFPVVIFPFAELGIYDEVEPKQWYNIDENEYSGFPEAFLNFNKNFEFFGEEGLRIWNNRNSQLELDNINLLYVALTRPKEQLYIITKKTLIKKTKQESEKHYSGLFIRFLKNINKWQDDIDDYCFGEDTKLSSKTDIPIENELLFTSSSRKDHKLAVLTKSGALWDSSQQDAIAKGNLIHLILSKIKYHDDVDSVLSEFFKNGTITNEQIELLKPILINLTSQSKLSVFYKKHLVVLNEKSIMLENGEVLVPDRVVIDNNKATIIDYKTGDFLLKHETQIKNYASVLAEIGYQIENKILVYLEDELSIREVN